MTLDTILLALYIGALIVTINKRNGLVALFCFTLAYAIASFQFSEPYQYHLALSLVATAGALLAYGHSLRVLFFAIMVYQYGMSLDAFLWTSTETILYQSYQYVAFLLNLIVIGYVGGGYGFSNSRDFIRWRWRTNYSSLALRQSDKARLRKGEA